MRPLAARLAYGILHSVARLPAIRNGFRVQWHDSWNAELEAALAEIPEAVPHHHELFREMMRNPGPVAKRTALVRRNGSTAALVGLRRIVAPTPRWELVTQWITPGFLFPVQPGQEIPALEALGVDLAVTWWRMPEELPANPRLRSLDWKPTYRMSFAGDYEKYWRETGTFKTVANARNHCRTFALQVNPPGITEWTIENWEQKWRPHPEHPDPSLADRILATRFLEARGQSFTLALMDAGSPVASTTVTVHGDSLVAGVIYRRPEFDRQKVGIRMMDATFAYAAENGYASFDIGGGFDYKAKWAPQAGRRATFGICPDPLFRGRRMLQRLHGPTATAAPSAEAPAP